MPRPAPTPEAGGTPPRTRTRTTRVRPTLKRPIRILLDVTDWPADLNGRAQRMARENLTLFDRIDEALREHTVQGSPAFAMLAPLLTTLLTPGGTPFREAPTTAVPMLI